MSNRGNSRNYMSNRGNNRGYMSNDRRPYGGRGRFSYRGGGFGGNYEESHSPSSSNRTPIILAKPERNENGQGNSNSEERQTATVPPTIEIESRAVLSRSVHKESTPNIVKEERPKSNDSPKPPTENYDPCDTSNFIPPRNVKLVDDQQFCEPLSDCMTENTDYIVVGIVGTQGVGKSFILNSVIKLGNHQNLNPEDTSNYNADGQSKPQADRTFRVQTFEKQMLSEHCTNGINAWIGADRIIYLDTQPLFSNSFLDRAVQLEKKFSFEFHGAENTIEVHSLQTIGYIMSICHVVLVVQEGSVCDRDFLERIRIAELLKPSNPACASFDDQSTTVEYAPEVIFVHNKLEISEMGPQNYEDLRKVYDEILNDGLNFRYKTGLSTDHSTSDDVNLIFIPDVESEEYLHYSDKNITMEKSLLLLRQTFSKIKMRPFTSNLKETEKTWFQHAQRSWENVKTSNFYMEYSRLLRNH